MTEAVVDASGRLVFDAAGKPVVRPLLHRIAERLSNRHHTFSVYLSAPTVAAWAKGGVDHETTRVIAGVADTALHPEQAAADTLGVLREMTE